MQYVRLQCRRARGGTFEFQLETQMLDVGERDAQCLRGCPVATQPLRALLACGGAETCRVHVALPVVGSGGVAGASHRPAPGVSPPAPGGAAPRCRFSLLRAPAEQQPRPARAGEDTAAVPAPLK